MSEALDRVREQVGLPTYQQQQPRRNPTAAARPASTGARATTFRPSAPTLPDVLAGSGPRADSLEGEYIFGLWILAAVSAASAWFHHVIAQAFARNGAGWAQTANDILTWPHPLAQPILAAFAAVVIVGFALVTRNFSALYPRDHAAVVVAVGAGALGVGPLLVVSLLFIIVWALIIAAIVVVVVGVLGVLFSNS